MKIVIFDNYKSTGYGLITKRINMGETIIPLAVKSFLSSFEIDEDELDTIQYFGDCSLPEKEKLLVVGHFGRQYEVAFMRDRNVVPVFISFAWKDYFLTDDEIKYFKQYEPILCRDEFTRETFRGHGIKAYLFGCITMGFPVRTNAPQNGKYYFVDVKEEYLKRVPKRILDSAMIMSQNIDVDQMNDGAMQDARELTKLRLNEYAQNAKVVFTSKLHCMTPCVAMGIPTVALGENFSYRYSFIDRYVENYSLEEFEKYDWTTVPKHSDMEEVKELQLQIGKELILRNSMDYEAIEKLDKILMQKPGWEYMSGIKKMIGDFANICKGKYIIWGASSGGYALNSLIHKEFPECELVSVVDSYAEGVFGGKTIEKPEVLRDKYQDVFVVISTISGEKETKEFLKKISKVEGRDFIYLHENM